MCEIVGVRSFPCAESSCTEYSECPFTLFPTFYSLLPTPSIRSASGCNINLRTNKLPSTGSFRLASYYYFTAIFGALFGFFSDRWRLVGHGAPGGSAPQLSRFFASSLLHFILCYSALCALNPFHMGEQSIINHPQKLLQ